MSDPDKPLFAPTPDGEEFPAIDAGGERRLLACLPPRRMMFAPPWRESGLSTGAPIRECDWRHLCGPVLDQDGLGACFPAGTRVRMEDGSEKPIEEVRTLDRVLTAEGRIGRVYQAMARDADDGLVRLSLWGHGHLRCTPEHPILTKRGYVQASKLRIDDWVRMPKYLPRPKHFVHSADHIPSKVLANRSSRRTRRFNAPEGRTIVNVRLKDVPDVLEMTPNAGRIFGFFFAEGACSSGKVVFTFNKAEESTHVAELVSLLQSEWGLEAHLQHRANNSINVVVYGTAWSMLFGSLCSSGSGSKRIHADLCSGPSNFLEGMLEAWLDGDGHERRNVVQGVTVSRDLALGMYDIAQALGRRPTIRRSEPKASHGVKARLPRWDLEMAQGEENHWRCQTDVGCVWRKVKGVEREEFEGPVFNLEVEGDHSYVAEGVGVHNCVGYSGASAFEQAWQSAGLSPMQFSPDFAYACVNGGRDGGAVLSDMIASMATNGMCPAGLVPDYVYQMKKISQSARDAAKLHKAAKYFATNTYQAILDAVNCGYAASYGITVGGRFTTLDAGGVAGFGFPRGGHALHAVGIVKVKAGPYKGQWGLLTKNSWTTDFGDGGYCIVVEDHFDRDVDAYAIVVPEDDSANIDPPTPILV